ncbi:hypothetical protein [Deinococcus xinjiangensis]|uniref:GspE/PulE/PilB domain-containing protein n=1 Tax=Deinococcus xinjiangensis TaxID=457454 RepID=UPI003365A9F6
MAATLEPQRVTEVWQAMAQASGQQFYARHSDLFSIEGHRLDFRQALLHGVVPHIRQGLDLLVVTHDPNVHEVEGLSSPVKVELVTPQVYQRVFGLIYPPLQGDTYTEAEALALATKYGAKNFLTCTIAQAEEQQRVTAEEAALARAIQNKYLYADPELTPPDPSVSNLLPLDTMMSMEVYPYRMTSKGLQVLMVRVDDAVLRTLKLVTQRQIEPVLTTQKKLGHLMAAHALQRMALDEVLADLNQRSTLENGQLVNE